MRSSPAPPPSRRFSTLFGRTSRAASGNPFSGLRSPSFQYPLRANVSCSSFAHRITRLEPEFQYPLRANVSCSNARAARRAPDCRISVPSSGERLVQPRARLSERERQRVSVPSSGERLVQRHDSRILPRLICVSVPSSGECLVKRRLRSSLLLSTRAFSTLIGRMSREAFCIGAVFWLWGRLSVPSSGECLVKHYPVPIGV